MKKNFILQKYGLKLHYRDIIHIITNFHEDFQQGTQAQNRNYRQKLDLKGQGETKVGGGGSILSNIKGLENWNVSNGKNFNYMFINY